MVYPLDGRDVGSRSLGDAQNPRTQQVREAEALHKQHFEAKTLIPFDPTMPHILWFQTWRGHIRKAKENPEQAGGWCQAAKIAQGEMVQYLAIELAKHNGRIV